MTFRSIAQIKPKQKEEKDLACKITFMKSDTLI